MPTLSRAIGMRIVLLEVSCIILGVQRTSLPDGGEICRTLSYEYHTDSVCCVMLFLAKIHTLDPPEQGQTDL